MARLHFVTFIVALLAMCIFATTAWAVEEETMEDVPQQQGTQRVSPKSQDEQCVDLKAHNALLQRRITDDVDAKLFAAMEEVREELAERKKGPKMACHDTLPFLAHDAKMDRFSLLLTGKPLGDGSDSTALTATQLYHELHRDLQEFVSSAPPSPR
eukprot:202160_1